MINYNPLRSQNCFEKEGFRKKCLPDIEAIEPADLEEGKPIEKVDQWDLRRTAAVDVADVADQVG